MASSRRLIDSVFSPMATSKCLAIWYQLSTLPTLSPIWSAPPRRPSSTAEVIGGEGLFGRGQQLGALAGAFFGQARGCDKR